MEYMAMYMYYVTMVRGGEISSVGNRGAESQPEPDNIYFEVYVVTLMMRDKERRF